MNMPDGSLLTGRYVYEQAHRQAYSSYYVYGDAVHEEDDRQGGFRMEHGEG